MSKNTAPVNFLPSNPPPPFKTGKASAQGLFEKSKAPPFSTNSGGRRVKKPRNLKGFLRFLPCILWLFANNPAIPLFSNKP
ncbi:hypothetical protein [Anaerotruncus colihominis]|uniref:Uncharacterized protein n=1 Tax=Anaerotruncus colihominis TaxID=169435 RepID=A0A845T720_9FIRM|nr:hypothetical protein [Anaerotruncus colihominis]MCR2024993.1 hypothetical protein [Anaerotruncus colihominis]NDO40161.1 hypothetical protein [Anaerotruncus colihominis]